MEFSADEKEGIIIRQIAELKDAVSKLNDNHFSLLEMFQQNQYTGKDSQEKLDLLSENVDDVKTTVCGIGERVERAERRIDERSDQIELLRKEIKEYVTTFNTGMETITKEITRFENATNNKVMDADNEIKSNKITVDRITDSFGTLLSKSNQALDCIEILQDRLSGIEKEAIKDKQDLKAIGVQLDKLKRKQKKKSKNITLMIK